jgi:short-subunit dehydrogenase
MELRGSIGILTGASRGLGVYIAEALTRKGVALALAARSEQELKETQTRVERLGGRAIIVPTDVGKMKDLETLVSTTTAELGPVDLLVNNAGIERYSNYEELDVDVIERTLRINLWAPEVLSRLVLPDMVQRRRGHIVNVASVGGKTAVPYNAVYSSSKHGLVGFSWSLREEMRSHGVGVSVVCPGFVSDSGMFHHWSQGEKPPSVSRMVTPEKVADSVVKAIEGDKAEIIVARGLTKIVDITHAISPAFTTAVARRTGAYSFLRKATKGDFRG